MRRRRAERLVLRANAAVDEGLLTEARQALAEARELAPSLPDLERLEHRLMVAEEPPAESAKAEMVAARDVEEIPIVPDAAAADAAVEDLPIADLPIQEVPAVLVEHSSGWRNTLAAAAAMLLLLGASGMFVLTLLESREGLTGRDLTAAAQLIDAPAAPFSAAAGAPPEAAPLPAVETIEPTGTAGYVDPPAPAVGSDTPAVRRPEAAPRPTSTTLPATAESPSAGAGASAETKRSAETKPSVDTKPATDVKTSADPKPVAEAPPPDRVERLETRESPDVPKVPVNTVPDARVAESGNPAPTPPPPAPSAASAAAPPAAAPATTPAAPPAAASAAPPTAPPAASPAIAQDALVRATLDRYAAAYSKLDADAAQRVWPGVNRDALARAFDGLAHQRVSLADCRINVTGDKASARCAGWTTWQPKVGAGERTDQRTWTFELAKAPEGWQIVNARVQNR